MTENEAIQSLENAKRILGLPEQGEKWSANRETIAIDIVISSIKELEKYRAIGTVEKFRQLLEQFKPHVTDEISCPERHCNKCDKYRKENKKYHEVGTVEECREAMERQRVKDIIHNPDGRVDEDWLCPTCGKFCSPYSKHCQHCGQAVKVGNAP